MKTEVSDHLIILDLDNTLYDYAPCHEGALSTLVRFLQQELKIKEDLLTTAYHEASQVVKNRLGQVASSHSRLLYIQEMCRRLNLRLEPRLILQAEQTYWSDFLGRMKPVHGLTDFLVNARRRGISLIVVTDLTSQIQLRKLQHLGIGNWIDTLVTSEELGSEKSNPLTFKVLDQIIGLNLRSEVWFLGDEAKDLPSDAELTSMGLCMRTQRFHRTTGRSSLGTPYVNYDDLIKRVGWF